MFNQYQNQPSFGFNAPAMPYMPDYRSTPAQPNTNISWVYVNGMDGAKSQIVQPNQTVWMMDSSDPVIYVKAVDSIGTATLKAFSLTEITASVPVQGQQPDLSGYAQKGDLDDIVKRLSAIEEVIGGLNA